jgi:hypothetical protein
LLITVATTVSECSCPASFSARARMARIWSPSTSVALGVHGEAAVGVPVEGESRGRRRARRPRLQVAHVGRAAVLVDVEAVGIGVDRDHLRALASNAAGPVMKAAPLAQSSTTFSPLQARSAQRPTRCAT